MKEQVFLSEQRIKVTNARLMVKDETYSMAGIISVKRGVIPGAKSEKTYTLKDKFKIIIFSLLLLGGFSQICLIIGGWVFNLIGLASLALMTLVIYAVASAKDGEDEPATYTISLRTASGELKALENQDRDFIDRVIKALNDAIVSRG
jgi:hypothetical protein